MRVFFGLLCACLLCEAASADQIDLSLNADALRAIYIRDLKSSKLKLDGGWLYNSDEGDVFHVGLTLPGNASEGANPVRGGLGGRLAYANGELSGQDGFALGIGGFLSYTLTKFNRVTFTGAAYFAPDLLTLGDMDKYQDYTLKAAYQFMREADVYLGLRLVKGDFDGVPSVDFDDGLHIGFNIRF